MILGILFLGFPRNAHAYLDPATGGYFAQIAIAFLIGFAYTLKGYWKRITHAIAQRFTRGKSDA